jgi:hypothetical protein
MFFLKGRSARAHEKIKNINLEPYLKKATELHALNPSEHKRASDEYRHFLYLIYWNRRLEGHLPIVPTKLADKLWHAHIIFTIDYAKMCDDVFGTFLHHQPGLEEGTSPFNAAVRHTRDLHLYIQRERLVQGFDSDYFSFADAIPTSPRKSSEPDRRNNDSGGCGGAYATHNVSNDAAPAKSVDSSPSSCGSSPSSCSSSGASSCGSSCGGGGCGGGCGG